MDLPEDLLALLRSAATCYVATTMADGSPQLTQTWVDTDGTHVLVNSVRTHVKTRNLGRDPRIALTVADPAQPSRYYQVRGRVAEIRTEGAVDHIEELSQRYLGRPYPWFGGRDQERVVFVVVPDRVIGMGG